jgi:MFS family permease
MMRALHGTLEQVSVTWGFAISAATLIGAVGGGWLADYLSRRDVRWYAWLPVIAFSAGALLYWIALAASRLWTFITLDFLAEMSLSFGTPVAFAAFHAVCGSRRRNMAIAIVFFLISLVGGGFGPLLAGVLSDGFAKLYGPESLRYALIGMVVLLVPSAAAFYKAAYWIKDDLED